MLMPFTDNPDNDRFIIQTCNLITSTSLIHKTMTFNVQAFLPIKKE